MFSQTYQKGSYIEIMSSTEKQSAWSIPSHKWKKFDNKLKTYIISLESSTSQLSYGPSLRLSHPYLLLQLYLFPTKFFTIDIAIADISNTKRRLFFTYSAKEIVKNPLYARLPNHHFPKGKWCNLTLDLQDLTNFCFSGSSFKSIDSISIHSFCKLRRVLTMKTFSEDPPKQFSFPIGLSYENKLITAETPKIHRKGVYKAHKLGGTAPTFPKKSPSKHVLRTKEAPGNPYKKNNTEYAWSQFYSKKLNKGHGSSSDEIAESIHVSSSFERGSQQSINEEILEHNYFPRDILLESTEPQPTFYSNFFKENGLARPYTPPFAEITSAKFNKADEEVDLVYDSEMLH